MNNTIKKIWWTLLCLYGSAIYAQNTPTTATTTSATAAAHSAYTNTSVNYIRTWEPNMPSSNPATISASGRQPAEVRQTTQYYDGMGRLIQTVAKGMSGSAKDLVTAVTYDDFGREQYNYLPYSQQTGSTSDGTFKQDPFTNQQSFYKNAAVSPETTTDDIFYNEKVYESSPLGRMTNTYAAGNSWAKNGANHPISLQYPNNTGYDSVRIWNVLNGVVSSSGTYNAGTLLKLIQVDEAGNKIITYTDNHERIILKKVQLDANPGNAHVGWLCTYYVYDDVGNISMILPPLAVQKIIGKWDITNIKDDLCYSYTYDGRNRMITKKVPGAGAVYLVYDVRDRLVFAQDAVERAKSPQEWMAIFYDNQDRPTMTAIYKATTTRDALQTAMNGTSTTPQTVAYQFPGIADLSLAAYDGSSSYTATNSITFLDGFESTDNTAFTAQIDASATGGTTTAQATSTLPNISSSALTPLVYNYYDDYTFAGKQNFISSETSKLRSGSNPYVESIPAGGSSLTTGRMTGQKVRVLDTDQWLTISTYYDDKGRIVQQIKDNQNGGKDVLTNQYDFGGKVLSTYLDHVNPHSTLTPHTTLLTMFSYDAAARMLSVKKRLNGDSTQDRTIAINTFDELARIQQTRLDVNTAGGQLDILKYAYNVRGWMKGINKDYITATTSTNWFGEELNYDAGFTKNQLTGNIAGVKWKSGSDNIARAYGYDYDASKRLIKADFTQQNTPGATWTNDKVDFSVSNLTYDANGNMLSMNQNGMMGMTIRQIDKLTYGYDAGNKLLNVTDNAGAASANIGDFTDGKSTQTGDDYAYDVNGNLIKDQNKNIESITYNVLNQPVTITVTKKGTITYQYDALGNRLRKTVVDILVSPSRTIVTDYIGGLIYRQDTLQYILHEEGRIRPVYQANATTQYTYDYFEKDHLGNVRVVLGTTSQKHQYAATMETAATQTENALFSNIDNTRTPLPTGYPTDNTTNPNQYVAKLNGTGNKIGPSLVLRVMAGDTIQVGVKGYYSDPNALVNDNTPAQMAQALVQALGSIASADGIHAGLGSNSAIANNFGSSQYTELMNIDKNQDVSTKPQAFLNYVMFDDQFNMVDDNSGVKQVQALSGTIQTLASGQIVIKKTGFIYIYTSNESKGDVYFDNLVVMHNSGPLLENTHYYPYGLAMAGISGKALNGVIANKYRFNDGTELNSEEFSDGSGLEMYETSVRGYDPQIGRFAQQDPLADYYSEVSPYVFAFDNPVFYNDPSGNDPTVPEFHDVYQLIDYISANGISSFPDGFISYTFGAKGQTTSVSYDPNPVITTNSNGVQGIWISYSYATVGINKANYYNEQIGELVVGRRFFTLGKFMQDWNDYRDRVVRTATVDVYGTAGGIMNSGITVGQLLNYGQISKDVGWWMGKNLKFYRIGWGGNGSTGARALATKMDARLGAATKVLGIAGIIISGVEAYDDYQTGNTNDLILHTADVAMGIIGVWGGPIGAGVSTIWFVGRVITSM